MNRLDYMNVIKKFCEKHDLDIKLIPRPYFSMSYDIIERTYALEVPKDSKAVSGITYDELNAVLLHELAHKVLGHCERTAEYYLGNTQKAFEKDFTAASKRQEYEADRWAVKNGASPYALMTKLIKTIQLSAIHKRFIHDLLHDFLHDLHSGIWSIGYKEDIEKSSVLNYTHPDLLNRAGAVGVRLTIEDLIDLKTMLAPTMYKTDRSKRKRGKKSC